MSTNITVQNLQQGDLVTYMNQLGGTVSGTVEQIAQGNVRVKIDSGAVERVPSDQVNAIGGNRLVDMLV